MLAAHLRKGAVVPVTGNSASWNSANSRRVRAHFRQRQRPGCSPGDNALLSPPAHLDPPATPDTTPSAPTADSALTQNTTSATYNNILSAATHNGRSLSSTFHPSTLHPDSQLVDQSAKPAPTQVPLPSCHVQSLYMKDYALVDEATVEFSPGLNVITGESGAGKSVLMGALDLILGGVASGECVRPPAELSILEGTFFLSAASYDTVRECLIKLNLPDKALPTVVEDGWQLVLKREVSCSKEAGTRSRCFVNRCSTSLRVLREVGAVLVDANGQHSALRLRDKTEQLDLLDRLAGTASLLSELSEAMDLMHDLKRQLQQLHELSDEEERERLQQLCDTVQRANIYPGEVASLRSQLRVLETRRAATEQCGVVAVQMAGDGGVLGALSNIERQLRVVLHQEQAQRDYSDDDVMEEASEQQAADELEEDDDLQVGEASMGIELMEEAIRKLVEAKAALAAAKASVEDYVDAFEYNEADHQELSDRLKRLERLIRHWDCRDDHELLELAAEAEAKLEKYYDLEDKQEEWEEGLTSASELVLELALQLSQRRRGVAGKLRESVGNCLKDLAMSDSRFDVQIRWQEVEHQTRSSSSSVHVPQEAAEKLWEQGNTSYRLFPSGLDQVEFLLAAAPAEPLRPLSAVASGGESARVMMALKAAPAHVLAQEIAAAADDASTPSASSVGGAPVLVLDELDSGVGSRLGFSVGQMLRRMTEPPAMASSQILCVTHLPQVACHAQHHIKVIKEQTEEGRARTRFVPLEDPKQRAHEVSAMLGLGIEAAVALMQKSGSITLDQAAHILGLLNPSPTTSPPANGLQQSHTANHGTGTTQDTQHRVMNGSTNGSTSDGSTADGSTADGRTSNNGASMPLITGCTDVSGSSDGVGHSGSDTSWQPATSSDLPGTQQSEEGVTFISHTSTSGSTSLLSDRGTGHYGGVSSQSSRAEFINVQGLGGDGVVVGGRGESGVVDRLMHNMLIDMLSVGWQMVEDMVPNNGTDGSVRGSKQPFQ